MNCTKMNTLAISGLIFCLLTLPVALVFAHGDGTSIVPATLTIKAGSELKVSVGGLTGTKMAGFKLKGMFGSYDLGKFTISSDDFDQVVMIPASVPPGSYSLSVQGGGKSAKVVVTIN